ncbi:unnamed protein product [Parnassius mnemosyne]|uniref:Uncharacterized protein n=1 Tax=Parnassius mnemosyne TaxID=213953 RepID=A0AAV1LD14_9NEOP
MRCKPLKKDTCNKCDSLRNKIKNCSSEEKTILVAEKEEHLKRAEELRIQMNQDLQRAKIDEKFECLTYDLEKTLPLPRIPTNIVFYKRQLWLYNSGIHASSNDVGYCNIWVEGEAGRGAQEIKSSFKPPQTLNELRNAALAAWDSIPQVDVRNIIQSMPDRMQAVIRARGGNTRY